MTETMHKALKHRRWAVSLRMTPLGFGWCVMKAGERNMSISGYITEAIEAMARQDLQRGGKDDDAA